MPRSRRAGAIPSTVTSVLHSHAIDVPSDDQHVHVRAAAAQRVPCADVEAPADDELHRRCKRELQPARQQFVVHRRAAGRTSAASAREGRRQDRGDHELAAQRLPRVAAARRIARALGGLVAADVRARSRPRSTAASSAFVRRARAVVVDARRLRREIDRCLDAGQAVERSSRCAPRRRRTSCPRARARHARDHPAAARAPTSRRDRRRRYPSLYHIPQQGIYQAATLSLPASAAETGSRRGSTALSVSSITSRSMPMPSPAVGGRPYSSARM